MRDYDEVVIKDNVVSIGNETYIPSYDTVVIVEMLNVILKKIDRGLDTVCRELENINIEEPRVKLLRNNSKDILDQVKAMITEDYRK